MSQENTAVKFIIHKTDGMPQTIKVVPSTVVHCLEPLNPMHPNKIIPNPIMLTSGDGNTKSPIDQAFESLENIQRNIECTSKLVQLSISSLASIHKSQKTIIKSEVTEIPEAQVTEVQPLEELSTPEFTVVPLAYSTAATSTVTSTSGEPKPVMSYTSRRRAYNEGEPQPEYTTKRRKHADKVGKGLRHFSMKVCEKVRTKGFTSYNEVADELVAEFAAGMHGTADSQQYDQKNIRRRVYDALNVLMAMNIISKEKKEIRWLGLPTNSIQECTTLEKEKQVKLDRINKKTQQLQELLLQHISFKSLIERNKNSEEKGVKPSPSSAIHLPFIVVNTSDKALIDCSISNDKTEYMFNFNKRFQIHDDIDILKRMGLLFGLDKGECSEEDIEKIKSMVPKSLEQYVGRMGRGDTDIADSLEDCDEGSEDENEEETFMKEEGEAEEQEEEADGNDSSDDSGSDVDV